MPTDAKTILSLEVPVIVTIGERRMSLEEVLALGPGAIIELDKSAEDPIGLMINNKPIGTGSCVKVAENFGIRIEEIGSVRERVEATAGPESLSL